jgi:hypothetical protein
MCYVKKYEYTVEPIESYKVIRNCSGCNRKSSYHNTNHFRVNANGNKIDIWLIYQCEVCKHTFNLSIYERIKPSDIELSQYERFLRNDVMLSNQYGMDKTLFLKNRAAIDEKGLNYKMQADSSVVMLDTYYIHFKPGDLVEIKNPYRLKIRTEKIVAEVLGVSRMKEQRLENNKMISVAKQDMGSKIRVWVKGDILDE